MKCQEYSLQEFLYSLKNWNRMKHTHSQKTKGSKRVRNGTWEGGREREECEGTRRAGSNDVRLIDQPTGHTYISARLCILCRLGFDLRVSVLLHSGQRNMTGRDLCVLRRRSPVRPSRCRLRVGKARSPFPWRSIKSDCRSQLIPMPCFCYIVVICYCITH